MYFWQHLVFRYFCKHFLYCTLLTWDLVLFIVYCTVYTIHCHGGPCVMFTAVLVLFIMYCTLYTVSMNTVYCKLLNCSLLIWFSILFNVYCTLHTVIVNIVYTVKLVFGNSHFILYTLNLEDINNYHSI